MNPTSLNEKYFRNLDAFRFFSFLSVFLSHTLLTYSHSSITSDFVEKLLTLNFLGVPFFFTLSSFLITYRLLIEKEKKGTVKLWRFYKNRILRIWPAYYVLLLVCFIILPFVSSLLAISPPTLPPVLPFVLFYVNFYMIENGVAFTFALSILWSISIEEQFYFVWGFITARVSMKGIAWAAVLLFCFSILFSYYYLNVLQKPGNNLVIHSFYVLQNFCTGAFIALICFEKQRVFKLLKDAGFYLAWVYVILPVACFFIKDMIILNVIKSLCFSLIIYDQAFNERRWFNAGRFAGLNYLGKISYGLYLYHALVFVVLQKQFNFFMFHPTQSIWVNLFQVSACFIITFINAHISYRFIESKFLALKSPPY